MYRLLRKLAIEQQHSSYYVGLRSIEIKLLNTHFLQEIFKKNANFIQKKYLFYKKKLIYHNLLLIEFISSRTDHITSDSFQDIQGRRQTSFNNVIRTTDDKHGCINKLMYSERTVELGNKYM